MKYYVTLCIPVYKPHADMFRFVLNNVQLATKNLKNYEILIGIQECSDETYKDIEAFKAASSAVRVMKYDKSISTRAKNRSELIKNADSDIIVLIDQDVIISEIFITEHLKVHEQYDNAYVSGKTYNRIELNADSEKFLKANDLNNITKLHNQITSIPCMEDPRAEPLAAATDCVDISKYEGCWRHFWTCNLSLRKTIIDKIGYFDNEFTGWGLEDDELAWRAFNNGCDMIYSHTAWGFHYPHPIDLLNNLNDWLRNMKLFLKKANNLEVECYSVFMTRFDFGFKAFSSTSEAFVDSPNLDFLTRRYKRNDEKPSLSLYINNHFANKESPFHYNINPVLARSKQENGCLHMSSVGVNTIFQDKEIEDSVVILDYLYYVDILLRPLILLELARISKNIIAYRSPFFTAAHNSEYGNRIISILNSLNANVIYK